jgi:hypothetical protein
MALSQPSTELLTSRRLILEGIEAVARADDISVRTGILLVDLGGETLLKAALRQYGKSVPVKSQMDQILEALIKATAGSPDLSFVSGVGPLRHMRNCVMHDGTGQDPAVARGVVEKAREIFSQLVHEVWKLDLMNLSLSAYISHQITRDYLEEASQAFNVGEYRRAASCSVAAYETTIERWTAFNQEVFGLREGPTDLAAQMVSVLSGGVFIPDLARFKEATFGLVVSRTQSGRVYPVTTRGVFAGNDRDKQAAAARLALDFAGGVALQIEDRIPKSFMSRRDIVAALAEKSETGPRPT